MIDILDILEAAPPFEDDIVPSRAGVFQSIGVNQAPGPGTDYPFIDPSPDIQYVLGDLFISYDDNPSPFTLPFRVAWMYGFGETPHPNPLAYTPAHAQDMVIVDAADRTVFDSTTAGSFSSNPWGNSLTTLEWIGASAVLRCTMRSVSPPWDPGQTVNRYIAPVSGSLDPRTCYRLPSRVRSISVNGTPLPAGSVRLFEGYNINLTIDPQTRVDGGRYAQSVRIRGQPGDGLGRSPPPSGVATPLYTLNETAPDAGGNMLLSMTDCYRLQTPAAITQANPRRAAVTPATLQVYNDCAPCCTCDDFVRTYQGIRRLYSRYSAIAAQAETTRDLLMANSARWNAQKDCRFNNSLRMVASAQLGCMLYLGITWCNMTQGCAAAFVLRVTMEGFADGAPASFTSTAVACGQSVRSGTDTGYVYVPCAPQGPYPVFDIAYDYADPQAPSSARMAFAVEDCASTDAIRVTLSVHAPDTVGTDGAIHPLPLISVPDAITALWSSRPPPYPARALLTQSVPLNADSSCM